MAESNKRINIYNPSTGKTSYEPLQEIFKYIPARVVHFRVFALNHDHDGALAEAAERIFYPPSRGSAQETNMIQRQKLCPALHTAILMLEQVRTYHGISRTSRAL